MADEWRGMKSASLLLVLGLGPLAGGCLTSESERPLATAAPLAHGASASRAFRILAQDDVVGEVVQFGLPAGDDSLFVVRNDWSQDLGVVDALGRAFRFVPHSEHPVWVGTGTVAQGAARILSIEGSCSLVEVDLPQPLGPVEPPRH